MEDPHQSGICEIPVPFDLAINTNGDPYPLDFVINQGDPLPSCFGHTCAYWRSSSPLDSAVTFLWYERSLYYLIPYPTKYGSFPSHLDSTIYKYWRSHLLIRT